MPFITRETVTATFLERVKSTPALIGFQYKTQKQWNSVTFREFFQECKDLSFALMSFQLKPGDRIAILSGTRYEWSLSDMAILGASCVTVPIYPSSTPEDITHILNHSGSRVIIVEDRNQLEKILALQKKGRSTLANLEKILVMDPTAMELAAEQKDVIAFSALKELGRREEARAPSRFEDNLKNAKPGDLITICYTSGTTGTPKGAMITHENMMSVLSDAELIFRKQLRTQGEVVLSFLPFSHVLGKVESMAIYVFGWKEAYAEHLDKIMTNMLEVRPTVIFAVPRIFEKALMRIQTSVEAMPLPRQKLFEWALKSGRRYMESVWNRKTPALADRVQYLAAKNLVFSKIVQRFGGRLKFAICGGAPLPKEIGETLEIMGLLVLEGYGLTETCAPVTLNTPWQHRFGTVGRPLPDVSVKIEEDGEVLIKSKKVFAGYYKMPDETAQALSGHWLHTGDVGFLDENGFLHITDRKKDLIITSAGKNVAPQKIENLAKTHKFMSQFVVLGDRRNYLTALITLEHEEVIRFAAENNILFSAYSELIKNPKVIGRVQKIVDEINGQLAHFETIKKFLILPTDFSIDGGELTPSLKVKRAVVNRKYKGEIDTMYHASSPPS